nr:helix-turn-helix domain-containing protein [Novosphingobium sp. FKTRR1]
MATRADSHGDGQANLRFPYLRHGPSAVTHPALVPPLAIERYRVLEPHLADGIPLADLARTGTLSERTLQRWLGRYRAEGLAGLARLPRNDRGRLHLPEHLVELTRTLATKRPRPPVAAIHRKVQELAIAHGHRTPSYAAVARVVRAIPASQIAAASDPAVYRDQHELVHRREAATSNEMWQADHTVLDILVLDDAGTRCVLG